MFSNHVVNVDTCQLPLFQERYDLIIPEAHYNNPLVAPLLGLLENGAFREAVARLPGYDVTQMGKIVK